MFDILLIKIASFKMKQRNLIYSLAHWISTSNLIQTLGSSRSHTKKIFTLDLHTSVVRDVTPALNNINIQVNRWSISGSSHLFTEPNLHVRGVRNSNWKKIDAEKIETFQNKYRKFLKKQDGFIITYTFSFIDLFSKYRKPILGINATRYESPFTFNEEMFMKLNETLKNYSELYVVSNNIADQEYLEYFSGVKSQYIPSLCSYNTKHKPETNTWVVLCRNLTLGKKISQVAPNIKTQEEVWPTGYTYLEFARVRGVIVIPYNISTMRMFELTTAGFPIRIPSDRLLLEWSELPGVLSELSYAQVYGRKPLKINLNSPMDPEWKKFYAWWLERADWNQSDLFPNISRFDSLDELAYDPRPFKPESIIQRNLKINEMWKNYLEKFEKTLDKKLIPGNFT